MCWAVAVSTKGMARKTESESPHLLIRRMNQQKLSESDLGRRYKSAFVQAKRFPEPS